MNIKDTDTIIVRIPKAWKKTLKVMCAEEETTISNIIRFSLENHPRFLRWLDNIRVADEK